MAQTYSVQKIVEKLVEKSNGYPQDGHAEKDGSCTLKALKLLVVPKYCTSLKVYKNEIRGKAVNIATTNWICVKQVMGRVEK